MQLVERELGKRLQYVVDLEAWPVTKGARGDVVGLIIKVQMDTGRVIQFEATGVSGGKPYLVTYRGEPRGKLAAWVSRKLKRLTGFWSN